MAKVHIRKDDEVVVIAGNDKGKKAKVKYVIPETGRAVVEGTNMVKKALRPTQQNPKGGISDREAPIDVSNLMLVCPKCDKPTRVGMQVLEDGSRVRVCKKCGAQID